MPIINVSNAEMEELRLLSTCSGIDWFPCGKRLTLLKEILARVEPMTAGNNRRWADQFEPKPVPIILVEIEDGVGVADVTATVPVRVLTAEYDNSEYPPAHLMDIPQIDGSHRRGLLRARQVDLMDADAPLAQALDYLLSNVFGENGA